MRARRIAPLAVARAVPFDLCREAARLSALAGIPCPSLDAERWDVQPQRSGTAYLGLGKIRLRLGPDADAAFVTQVLLHELCHFISRPYPKGDVVIAHGPPFRQAMLDLCAAGYGPLLGPDLPATPQQATATLDRRMVGWLRQADVLSYIQHLQAGEGARFSRTSPASDG